MDPESHPDLRADRNSDAGPYFLVSFVGIVAHVCTFLWVPFDGQVSIAKFLTGSVGLLLIGWGGFKGSYHLHRAGHTRFAFPILIFSSLAMSVLTLRLASLILLLLL